MGVQGTQVKLQVPEGAPPGTILQVPVKGGSDHVKVRVPDGVGAGSTLILTQPEGSDEWSLKVADLVQAGPGESVAPHANGHSAPLVGQQPGDVVPPLPPGYIETRAGETSGTDEVSEAELLMYANAVATSLSRGYEIVHQAIVDFFEQRSRVLPHDSVARSSFLPFDIRPRGADADELERICVDLTLLRRAGGFQVSYHSRVSTLSNSQASGQPPAQAYTPEQQQLQQYYQPVEPPPASLESAVAYSVRLETTVGPIDIIVRPDWAPQGTRRFLQLAASGDFADLAFYRAIKGCIAQFGLPAKRLWPPIPDDPATGVPFLLGAVSFAAIGENSRKSTLFICTGDMSHCLGQQPWETPIGAVAESSLDVLDKIETCYGDIAEFDGTGPDTNRINQEGNSYLRANFPRLTFIRTAAPLDWPEASSPSSVPAANSIPQAPCGSLEQTTDQVNAALKAAQEAQSQADRARQLASQAAQAEHVQAAAQAAQAAQAAAEAAQAAAEAAQAAKVAQVAKSGKATPGSYTSAPLTTYNAPSNCGYTPSSPSTAAPARQMGNVGSMSSSRRQLDGSVVDVPIEVQPRHSGVAVASTNVVQCSNRPSVVPQPQVHPPPTPAACGRSSFQPVQQPPPCAAVMAPQARPPGAQVAAAGPAMPVTARQGLLQYIQQPPVTPGAPPMGPLPPQSQQLLGAHAPMPQQPLPLQARPQAGQPWTPMPAAPGVTPSWVPTPAPLQPGLEALGPHMPPPGGMQPWVGPMQGRMPLS